MEFYLKLDRSRVSDEKTYDVFIRFSVGKLKNILYDNLDYNKCANYDKLLRNQCSIIGVNENFFSKDFTYRLLNLAISSIEHTKTHLGEHFYKINIPLNNEFGSKLVLDKIIRIVEYGQGTLPPYKLFNSGFIKYKDLISKRFNKLF